MFLKRPVAFVIAWLLLVSNTGFALSVHYCGGRVSSVTSALIAKKEISAKPEDCCGTKVKSHKSCCSDKTFRVKAKRTDGIAKFQQPNFSPAIFPDSPGFFQPIAGFSSEAAQKTAFHCDCHAPPLFKLHCQLVFYA